MVDFVGQFIFIPDDKKKMVGKICISCYIGRVSLGKGVRALFKVELLD